MPNIIENQDHVSGCLGGVGQRLNLRSQPSHTQAVATGLVKEFSHGVHLVPADFGKIEFRLGFGKLRLQLRALLARRHLQLLPKRVHLYLTVLSLLVQFALQLKECWRTILVLTRCPRACETSYNATSRTVATRLG